jgi:hypothetical protein
MDLKITLISAALAFGVMAVASQIDFNSSTPAPAPAPAQTDVDPRPAGAKPRVAVKGASSYGALLIDLDERIAALQKRVDGRPRDWLTMMHLGSLLFERAALTNQLDDYDRVQALLDKAFAVAAKGSGPTVLAARFNFSIHRLTVAEEYLDIIDRRAVPRLDDSLIARVLRAQIAVQRGQYAAAKDLEAIAAKVPAAAGTELAFYYAKTGKPAEAEALFEAALEETRAKDPQRRAWLKLQIGLVAMNRGELRAAMKHLRDADADLPGWWLVQEHIAEVHQRLDEHAEAIAIYESLIPSADLPQHMDALAGLYRHTGQPDKADELIAKAAARWDKQLARYPEAMAGHALQHYLRFGPPERALELALANHAVRPGGDAEVALARAYLQTGKPAEALAAAERALATPYRTAALHDVAAKAHAALGHTAAAE